MATPTLDDFMALNEQLVALGEAGVPIDVDLGQSGGNPAVRLEKINAAIARSVSQGASLTEAIQEERHVVTPSYRGLVQRGLLGNDLAASVEGSSRASESLADSWQAATFSLLYPVIVFLFAYVGLVACCLFFVPTLRGMYQDMGIQPGTGLRVLESLRRTLPYWVAIPPVALVLMAASARLQSKGVFSLGRRAKVLAWLPGLSRAIDEQRTASFAESLAALVNGGMPLAEALPTAGAAWGDSASRGATQSLAARLASGQEVDDSNVAFALRPFLRWALWHSEPAIGRAQALAIAADIYRESARRRIERWRTVAPVVLCVVLGGGVTLLYALVLFVPVVEMLKGLAS